MSECQSRDKKYNTVNQLNLAICQKSLILIANL